MKIIFFLTVSLSKVFLMKICVFWAFLLISPFLLSQSGKKDPVIMRAWVKDRAVESLKE